MSIPLHPNEGPEVSSAVRDQAERRIEQSLRTESPPPTSAKSYCWFAPYGRFPVPERCRMMPADYSLEHQDRKGSHCLYRQTWKQLLLGLQVVVPAPWRCPASPNSHPTRRLVDGVPALWPMPLLLRNRRPQNLRR